MKKYSKEIVIVIIFFAIICGIIVMNRSHTPHEHGDGKVHSHP